MEKQPILDYLYLMDSLRSYASPRSKLSSMVRSGELTRVRRGLYLAGKGERANLLTLANRIYGPSYVSFEYALYRHGLIPERAMVVTSAVMDKNKHKLFTTSVGTFSYASVPAEIFPYGIIRDEEDGSPFLVASPEKALCDTLSKIGRIVSYKRFKTLLFEDMRVDRNVLLQLDKHEIGLYASLYRKRAVEFLFTYMQKEQHAQCS